MKRTLGFVAFLFAITSALHAQDISGSWQGAIGNGKDRLRLILQIDKARGWRLEGHAIFSASITGADGFMPSFSPLQQGSDVTFYSRIPETLIHLALVLKPELVYQF